MLRSPPAEVKRRSPGRPAADRALRLGYSRVVAGSPSDAQPPSPPATATTTATGAAVLVEAEAAFELGDWRRARALARLELDGPDGLDRPDEARRAAGREMVARFTPDPQLVVVYLAAVILLLWLLASHLPQR